MSKTKFDCEFCKRSFTREKSFINHSCEQKRRWYSKDEYHSRLAFAAWNRFYELNTFSKKKEFKSDYRNFITSQYYNAFIKFGKHIKEINAIEPTKFIDYVLKGNIPIDKWTHEIVYEQYIHELIRKETPEDALERNIRFMNEWSEQVNEEWTNFFRKVNPNQAILWIKNGRISPWILYNVDSAIDLFERCTPEQISMIKTYAAPGPWKLKFNKNAKSCEFIKTILKQNGM